jgi:glycosyltransferase involved in cell wall biosynthesis
LPTLGLDDAVRFLGYLDRQRELPGCYKAADLFVFASRTETQGWCCSKPWPPVCP